MDETEAVLIDTEPVLGVRVVPEGIAVESGEAESVTVRWTVETIWEAELAEPAAGADEDAMLEDESTIVEDAEDGVMLEEEAVDETTEELDAVIA